MNRSFRIATLGILVLLALGSPASSAGRRSGQYVCAPCDLDCDAAVYDHAGTCPKCGMKLVEKEVADRSTGSRRRVGILVFDGVQIIDSMGPYEIFGAAGFEVATVAESKSPITTAMRLTLVPRYTFADAPRFDVLVVPGGGVEEARHSEATLRFVRETTSRAEHTLSVCNGAFILASAGLLDGLTATTTAHLIPALRAEFPRTKVVDDRRFVD